MYILDSVGPRHAKAGAMKLLIQVRPYNWQQAQLPARDLSDRAQRQHTLYKKGVMSIQVIVAWTYALLAKKMHPTNANMSLRWHVSYYTLHA